MAHLLMDLEMILRLILGAVCGGAIGYERKNRLKEAGIRTHLIVSLASTLMMIVSKYGCFDVIKGEGMSADASRIAASVVSGIGFLGAGMIFVRRQSVSGLTTAAGIWATSGVGLAIGAGQYVLGIAATVLIIFTQIVLHRKLHWLKIPVGEQIDIILDSHNQAGISGIQQEFHKRNIEILEMKVEKLDKERIEVEIYAKLPEGDTLADVVAVLEKNPCIRSIEM